MSNINLKIFYLISETLNELFPKYHFAINFSILNAGIIEKITQNYKCMLLKAGENDYSITFDVRTRCELIPINTFKIVATLITNDLMGIQTKSNKKEFQRTFEETYDLLYDNYLLKLDSINEINFILDDQIFFDDEDYDEEDDIPSPKFKFKKDTKDDNDKDK